MADTRIDGSPYGYESQAPQMPSEGRMIAGGVLGAAGLIGGVSSLRGRSYDVYDPSQTALSRYRELTDPTSNYHQRLQSLYSKYFAEGSPTINSMLGVSNAAGIDNGSGAALAYQKARQQTVQNNDQVLTALQREMLNSEQTAQGYLGLHYNMLREQSNQNFQASQNSQESGGSFFDQMLGLGGGLLSKALI